MSRANGKRRRKNLALKERKILLGGKKGVMSSKGWLATMKQSMQQQSERGRETISRNRGAKKQVVGGGQAYNP